MQPDVDAALHGSWAETAPEEITGLIRSVADSEAVGRVTCASMQSNGSSSNRRFCLLHFAAAILDLSFDQRKPKSRNMRVKKPKSCANVQEY